MRLCLDEKTDESAKHNHLVEHDKYAVIGERATASSNADDSVSKSF